MHEPSEMLAHTVTTSSGKLCFNLHDTSQSSRGFPDDNLFLIIIEVGGIGAILISFMFKGKYISRVPQWSIRKYLPATQQLATMLQTDINEHAAEDNPGSTRASTHGLHGRQTDLSMIGQNLHRCYCRQLADVLIPPERLLVIPTIHNRPVAVLSVSQSLEIATNPC